MNQEGKIRRLRARLKAGLCPFCDEPADIRVQAFQFEDLTVPGIEYGWCGACEHSWMPSAQERKIDEAFNEWRRNRRMVQEIADLKQQRDAFLVRAEKAEARVKELEADVFDRNDRIQKAEAQVKSLTNKLSNVHANLTRAEEDRDDALTWIERYVDQTRRAEKAEARVKELEARDAERLRIRPKTHRC